MFVTNFIYAFFNWFEIIEILLKFHIAGAVVAQGTDSARMSTGYYRKMCIY